MHKDYSVIKEELEKQKAIPTCRNCHSIESSKIYNDFEHIITKKDLFSYNNSDIKKMIGSEIEHFINHNQTSYNVPQLQYEVERWIKKRAVIEQIFDGKCIVCDEKRLPALESHHTNPDLKEHKWSKIAKSWDIKELANNFVIKEEVVFICGNCHAMENTKHFENNITDILGEKYEQDVKEDYNKIHDILAQQKERIKDLKNGNIELVIRDYLNDE